MMSGSQNVSISLRSHNRRYGCSAQCHGSNIDMLNSNCLQAIKSHPSRSARRYQSGRIKMTQRWY